MKRKRYARKFQRMAVERMRNCEDVGGLARECITRTEVCSTPVQNTWPSS
jgi:hypothetical protein